MQLRMLLPLSVLLVALLLSRQAAGQCNVCSEYGIACVSETEFHICDANGIKQPEMQTCPEGRLCTAGRLKCAATTQAACPNAVCGCQEPRMFACTSRTTFAQCNGNEIIQTGTCPAGLICDSLQPEICVDSCNLKAKVECDREAPAILF